MTVLRRLDAVLEPTKKAVLDMKESLNKAGVTNQDATLRKASGQAFYNTSKFTLRDLRARASQQQLKADFEAYLDGFSPNVQACLPDEADEPEAADEVNAALDAETLTDEADFDAIPEGGRGVTEPPDCPQIYHITHLDNLSGIIREEAIWSDAKRCELDLDCSLVGMSNIKRRRLEELVVNCHAPRMVGEFVPFYFCPRSIMLFMLHCANHPELTYRGGQRPIVHLQADLHEVVEWADEEGVPWAFSDCNAGTRYADFYRDLDQLHEVNWRAVRATDFRDSGIKEGKQAEFLYFESFPWQLIDKIGVFDDTIRQKVDLELLSAEHSPQVVVKPNWYY